MRENILCFPHIHTLYIYATSSAYSSSSRRTFRRSVTEFRHHRENFIWPGRASRGHNERCLLNQRTHATHASVVVLYKTTRPPLACARKVSIEFPRTRSDFIHGSVVVGPCYMPTAAVGLFVRAHRTHHVDAAYCYGRRTFRGLCVTGLRKLCKTAEQFGRQSCVGPKDHY